MLEAAFDYFKIYDAAHSCCRPCSGAAANWEIDEICTMKPDPSGELLKKWPHGNGAIHLRVQHSRAGDQAYRALLGGSESLHRSVTSAHEAIAIHSVGIGTIISEIVHIDGTRQLAFVDCCFTNNRQPHVLRVKRVTRTINRIR
jgi:hypothetical protein